MTEGGWQMAAGGGRKGEGFESRKAEFVSRKEDSYLLFVKGYWLKVIG